MISVIVVNHNTVEHLRHCLAQLQPASGENPAWGEVLVVDNASQDGSVAMVQQEFPGCRLLALDENLGFGTANNRAAAVARGDFLLFLNSDAWLAPGSLELLRQALEREPTVALAAPQLHYPDGRLQFTWVPETGILGEALQKLRNRYEDRRWNHRWLPWLLRAVTGPGWFTAACILVRRSAFVAIGGFDEEIFLYFEDVDLSRRLRQAGWKLRAVPAATAFHVKGASRPSDRGEIEYRRGQLHYYRKHRPRREYRLLQRRLRRKFQRVAEPGLRAELLALLERP